jgi:hypothetical protein
VEQVAAVGDARHFELALRDQSIEQPAQRRRPELVPNDPRVGLVASVELAGADPAHRTFHRDRLLLIGKVIDASVQNARELFPLVAWNLAKRAHEAMTVGVASDAKPPPYSHSIVPGGFDVMSSVTRFTCAISLIIREATRSSRS